jgi:ABC-2 type transport system ATP-binding protein
MSAVSLEGLRVEFEGGARPALGGVSARIAGGRITGLVGPDGAGKTTLIRLMVGLLAPSAGTLRVLGLDPAVDPLGVRTRTGYMPQRFGLYEDLSVEENLNLYADLRAVFAEERAQAFERLLRFSDLARFRTRLAGRLSGGMKQKLGLACALLGHPELLLLDEPSVGVDPISRRELWSMVRSLAGEGIGIVWSTSYLDEAERCDDVLLLNEGGVLYQGPPAGLTGTLAGRSFHLQGCPAQVRRGVLERALGRAEVVDGVIQGCNVRLVLGRDHAGRPLSPEVLTPAPGARMVAVPPRFEDAFVDRLGGGPGGHSRLAERVEPLPARAEAVIQCEGLTRRFGDFTAARDISFEIHSGEIFGLLGPNGAGKSTTFKMLCGLLRPSAGRARVTGLDLEHAPSEARARIGYMAQKFSLYGNLSVRQNLDFFAGLYGLGNARRRAAVEQMIEIFALAAYLPANADTLPLGFKQRLALACAVMHGPAVLFLDEPTSGVDPITRREFWTHINGLVERGVTIMVTTHFMDEAEYCDRIALVYAGEVIATGAPDDLKAEAADREYPDPTLEDAFIALVRRHDREALAA